MQRRGCLLKGTLFVLGIVLVGLVGVPRFSPTRAMSRPAPARATLPPAPAPPRRPALTPTAVLPPRPALEPTSGIPDRPTSTPTSGLPPRPGLEPRPTRPSQTKEGPEAGLPPPYGGATIELHVLFSPAQRVGDVDWLPLWTIVQWQDLAGNWHDVEGWRGALDGIMVVEGGVIVGRKTWWVDRADLGKGPFHWSIYQDREEEGRSLAISESFRLPGSAGASQRIEVTLP